MSVIEIDLSSIKEDILQDKEKLTDNIINGTKNKNWLYNLHLDKKIKQINKDIKNLINKHKQIQEKVRLKK